MLSNLRSIWVQKRISMRFQKSFKLNISLKKIKILANNKLLEIGLEGEF